MHIIKPFIKHITYPIIASRDGYTGFRKILNELEKSQYWPLEKLKIFQYEKLKSLLTHAYENTSFYRKRFDECDFSPYKFQNFADLEKIPRLTKQDFINQSRNMCAKNYRKDQLHKSESGGTTGIVTVFYRNNNCLGPKYAAALRFDKWAGWEVGDWISLIWPATLDNIGKTTPRKRLRNSISYRKLKLAMMVIEEELIEEHLKQIQKYEPKVTRGFVSTVFEVAKYLKAKQISDLPIEAVITTGEPLYPHQRKVIEEAFNSPVYDSYRTREVGVIGQECEEHQGFHINSENVYLEIESQEDSEQKEGRVLLTDLLNYGMPIIRYEIGDVGKLSNDLCSCGRYLPLLQEVGGRLSDVLYTPEGKAVAAITLIPMLIFNFNILNQVQFVQDDFDHLLIRMSKPSPSKEIMEGQKKLVNEIFNTDMKVSYDFVDEIPLLPSGKYPFIVCNIPKEKLSAKLGHG